MFVDNFEDMFEGFGLFKCPLATYNNEVLNKYVFACVIFIEIAIYDAKYGSKYSPFLRKKIYNYSTQ